MKLFSIARMIPLLSAFLAVSCTPSNSTIDSGFLGGIRLDVSKSTITVSDPVIISGAASTILVTTRDQNGAAFETNETVTIQLSTSGGTSVGTFSAVTALGHGAYRAIYTGSANGTPTVIRAKINNQDVSGVLPSVQVLVGNYSLSNSTVALSSATVVSGSTVTATLTVRDSSNQALTSGGLTVVFSNTGGTGSAAASATTDNHDGTYTATFTGATSGTATSIRASIGGSVITSSLPTLTVSAGAVSQMIFSTSPSSTGNTDTALTAQPVVTAKDAAGNTVTSYTSAITLTAYSDSTCSTSVASGLSAASNPVSASSGVSTFSTVKILKPSVVAIGASDGTRSVCSSAMVISVGAAASIAVSSGNSQSAAHGTQLSTAFVAVVKDAQSNVISSATVDWAVTAGSGSLSGTTTSTDTSGTVTSTLTLGAPPGTNTVTATVHGTALVATFTATGTSTALTSNIWNLVTGNSSSFDYDTNKIDFAATGGVCELIPNVQSGLGGGTVSGAIAWDATNNFLRLQNGNGCVATNTCAELDSSWTPKYKSIAFYWKMNGTVGGITPTGIVPEIGIGSIERFNDHATFTAGKAGSGVQIPGDGSGFSLVTSGIETISDKLSIGGWIKTNGGSVNPWGMFTQFADSNSGWYLQRWASSSSLFLGINTSGGSANIGGTSMAAALDNTWHHFTFVVGGGSLDAYLDGALMEHTTYPVGAGFASTGAGTRYLAGGLLSGGSVSYDEFTIWHDTLTAGEVKTIYDHQVSKFSGAFVSKTFDGLSSTAIWTDLAWNPNLPFGKEIPITNELQATYPGLVNSLGVSGDSSLATNLAGLWHLDETVGVPSAASIVDATGHATGGTAGSGTTLVSGGKLGNAAKFSGTSSYIDLPHSAAMDATTELTLSAWIKTSTTGTTEHILFKSDSTSISPNWGENYRLTNAAGYPGLIVYLADRTSLSVFATTLVSDGIWHLVTASYKSGTGLKIYVDGKFSNSAAGTGTLLSSAGKMVIGAEGGHTQNFNGLIDEAAVWSRVLDPKEVLQIYRRGANRLKFQIRSCGAVNVGKTDCTDITTDANWKGPNGTSSTYYSEINNVTGAVVNIDSPKMTFVAPTPAPNQYFQYRAIFESDDASTTQCSYDGNVTTTWCSPELSNANVGPLHFDKSAPTVTSKTGIAYYSLSDAVQTLGTDGCASGVLYNLGVGATYDVATWYWWNGTAWALASGGATGSVTTASTFASLTASSNAALTAFHTSVTGSTGVVYLRAFLQSTGGNSTCQLNSFRLNGVK